MTSSVAFHPVIGGKNGGQRHSHVVHLYIPSIEQGKRTEVECNVEKILHLTEDGKE